MERIGLVGVGLMGHGIAKNLVTKGWRVNYLQHPGNQPTDDIDSVGAVGWSSLTEMAAACDVIILCVTGSPQVEDVLEGTGRLLEALGPEHIVIDCSTAVPSSTIALAAKVEARGAKFVDSPMTRTPKEAEEGRLNLLVGGDADIVERLKPIFSSFAENVFYAGGVSSGHQLKLLHNFVSLGTVTLMTEAVACAARAGISMKALTECLKKGGGNGVALDRLLPFIDTGETAQLRFTIANACKDFDYYNLMAEDLGASHLIAASIKNTLHLLVERGDGMSFMPEQIPLLEQYGDTL